MRGVSVLGLRGLLAGSFAVASAAGASSAALHQLPVLQRSDWPLASSWTKVPATTIAGDSVRFTAVAVPAGGDVWAVGYTYSEAGGTFQFSTLAEHLVKGRLRMVSTPNVSEPGAVTDFLYGASGTSADDLWAVGYWVDSFGRNETLAEHWNGRSWAIVRTPKLGTDSTVLQAVAAEGPSNAWAVGALTEPGRLYQRPLAERWTGSAWVAVPVPNPSWCGGQSALTSVTTTGRARAFAAGWCTSPRSPTPRAYIEVWNGKAWDLSERASKLAPAGTELASIDATSRSNVWAVGSTQPPGSSVSHPFALHFNGKAWTASKVSSESAQAFDGVATSPTSTWAVGSGTSPQPPFAAPVAAEVVGSAWRSQSIPLSFGSLTSVAIDATTHDAWAVGLSPSTDGNDVPVAFVSR